MGTDPYSSEFAYGRQLIIKELKRVVGALPPGSRVLDVGSGTGHLLNWLVEQGFTAVGVEPSMEMRATCGRLFPHIEVREGFAHELPFPDGSFDALVCVEVLRYLHPEDVVDAYREFWRVLRKGGVAFITMVNRWALDGYLLYYRWKRLTSPHYHYTYFTTACQQMQTLQECGFERVQAVGVMHAFIRLFYKLGRQVGTFLTRCVEQIDKEQRWEREPWRSLAGTLILVAEK